MSFVDPKPWRPEEPEESWSCILQFDDESPSFVHGFEAGQIWQSMRSRQPLDLPVHGENLELIQRMFARQNWEVKPIGTGKLGLFLSEKVGSFSDITLNNNRVQSIDSKLINRIYGRGRGSAFTPNDFLDLGARNAKRISTMTQRDNWKKGERVHILGGRDIWTVYADQDDDDVTLVNGHGVIIECDWARIRGLSADVKGRTGIGVVPEASSEVGDSVDSELPLILFDSYQVYKRLNERAKARTSTENVSDVLDAIVKVLREQEDARCEGCNAKAATFDSEGVPLCEECAKLP